MPTTSIRRRSASSATPRSSGAAALRTTFGLRGDVYRWNVDVRQPAQLRQRRRRRIVSPKVSAAFGPWSGTEFYANWGLGFHSNSGLGIVLQVDPVTGDPATPSPPFARAQGAEFGVRTVALSRAADDRDGLVPRTSTRS